MFRRIYILPHSNTGLKLSLLGKFLFFSAILWLSLKSKSSLIVQNNKRKIPGNVFIYSELTILPEKQCCIWISTRDVIQRKFSMPTKRFHLMDFNINNKKSHVLLCILLSGVLQRILAPQTCPAATIYVGLLAYFIKTSEVESLPTGITRVTQRKVDYLVSMILSWLTILTLLR